jgi:hypothetical protein
LGFNRRRLLTKGYQRRGEERTESSQWKTFARRRFSDSRLKDLGDEYSENYPQISVILSMFYGLGSEFTLRGIDAFVKKLLVDDEVKTCCATWLYQSTAPERFLELLYNIGFMGIKNGDNTHYRSLGARTATPPPIAATVHGIVHPSYVDALNLRPVLITDLDEAVSLRSGGLLAELPESLDAKGYQDKLMGLELDLKPLAMGKPAAADYEAIVGEVTKLCFHYSLNNVEPKVREVDGCVIRDWIAANIASSGFWEMIRHKYHATQVIWECKNYKDLKADDFQQAAYYMNQKIGNFSFIVFRGDIKQHYYSHIKRIADDKQGMVLLLTEEDLIVFIRQARNGKVKEGHIRERYDRTVRSIA